LAAHVYIVASKRNGTLYIGVTTHLRQRAWQHREGIIPGFTQRYSCKMLVWYEEFSSLDDAQRREVQMKQWKRLWKLELIEAFNPQWRDLYLELNC
jgi:putative endonuclease